ncbi:unnamed protein product [marine sediment metagenome]|uniref:Uncharacterized protein n=1 Tax=marine sediment metagenome TaxID=412755 RepID=X1FWS7_9ZZZZ
MAVENFTTYTELDDNNRIEKTSTRVTWASMTRDETAYVSKDFEDGYFDRDFGFLLTVNTTAINYTTIILGVHWAVANLLDSLSDLKVADGDELYLSIAEGSGGVAIQLSEVVNGVVETTDSVACL